MVIRNGFRVSRLNEFLSHVCFLSLTHVSIVLLLSSKYCYCAQVRKSDLYSELRSTDFSQQNSSTQSLRDVISVRKLDQKIFQNVSGLVTPTPVARHLEAGSEGMELVSLVTSDDYEDYGDFNLSYVGPEVLLDLGPEEMVLSHDEAPPRERQKMVKDGFERDQEMELLRLHNFYRGNVTPPAADMSFMEWNSDIARTAQDWANQCEFRHGFPPHSYPGAMGQNLYMGHDPTGVRALLLWFEEYQYYNLKTFECVTGKQCGHYTQMAWGESSLVGCGMKRCGVRRFFVVCHYNPPGNVVGHPPYVVGKPCSQCPLDRGGLCTHKLCVTEDQCNRNPQDCNAVCPLECHNCGILNRATCKCSCPDGWDSLDCSRRCTDAHESCGKNPGWPTVTACSMNHHAVADIYCRKMCGKCRDTGNPISANTCCDGVLCDHGYVLDLKHSFCQCKLLCPGPECHDSSSDEDSGSQYPSKNICVIMIAMAFQMIFRL